MPELHHVDLGWMDTAPIQVTASRRIDAPTSAVWAVIADHVRWPEWFRAASAVEPGPIADAVGGTRRVRLGRVWLDEVFVAFEPERRFAFRVVQAPVPGLRALLEDVTLSPVAGGGTEVTYRQGIDLAGARMLRPVVRRTFQRGVEDGLRGLAAHVAG